MASNSPDTPPRLKLKKSFKDFGLKGKRNSFGRLIEDTQDTTPQPKQKKSYNDFGTLKTEKRNSFGRLITDTPPQPKQKKSYNDFGTLKTEKRNSFGRLIEPTPQQPSSPVDDQLRLIWRKKHYLESDAGGDEQTDSVSILLQENERKDKSLGSALKSLHSKEVAFYKTEAYIKDLELDVAKLRLENERMEKALKAAEKKLSVKSLSVAWQLGQIPGLEAQLENRRLRVEELEFMLQDKYDLMVPKGTDTLDLHTWAYKWESMKDNMRHVIAKSKHCISSPLMVALVVFVLITIHIFYLTVLS